MLKTLRAAIKDSVVVTLLDDDKVGHDMAESTDAIKIGVVKRPSCGFNRTAIQT